MVLQQNSGCQLNLDNLVKSMRELNSCLADGCYSQRIICCIVVSTWEKWLIGVYEAGVSSELPRMNISDSYLE